MQNKKKKLSFLITAGPTREFIDPVRFISNPSTGKMGYALADCAKESGYTVKVISGPTFEKPIQTYPIISVVSAQHMCDAVLMHLEKVDVLIMAAAVCDYRPIRYAEQKLKKDENNLFLELERTKDILQEVNKTGFRGIKVGFAAETTSVEKYALDKLQNKQLNVIVANDVSRQGAGFASETNIVTIFSDMKDRVDVPLLPKSEVARHIIDYIVEYIGRRGNLVR